MNRAIPVVMFFCAAGLIMTGCKKKRAFNEESAQATVDARMVQGESDEVIRDVNIAIMEDYLLRGRQLLSSTQAAGTSLCGVILDTTKTGSGILTLKYDGSTCYGRTRTGSVRFTIGGYPLKKWKNAGTVVKIEYLNYKMVRSSDGKSVQLAGTQEMTNESGNTWFELWYMSAPQVVYKVTGSDMKVTFDGNQTAVFNFSRRLSFTFAADVTSCRVQGTGDYNGRSGLENWGQTRDGEVFTSGITVPPVWKSECGAMAPVSGELSLQVEGKEFDLRCFFGVDSEGEASADKCPFGWRVDWSRKNKTNSRTFGYY